MRTVRLLITLAVLAPFVIGGFVLAACGVNWFPKCEDPKHPCPPVEPDYPSGLVRDAATDRRVDMRDVGHD
jgi:hypothetical protein